MVDIFSRCSEIIFVQGDQFCFSALDSDDHSCAAQRSLFLAVQEESWKRVAIGQRSNCLRRSHSDYMFLSTGHQSSADVAMYPHRCINLDPARCLAEIHLFAINFWPCGNTECLDSRLQQVRPAPPGASGSAY